MRKNSLRKRAFTLVELIVVIAIVAILVAVLVATFMKVIEKSHESTALSDANNLIKTLIPELMDEENSTDLLVFCAKGGKIYAHGFQHDIRRVLPYKNGPFVQDEEDINDQVNGAIITALTTDGYITVDTSVTEDSWRSAANIKQMLEGNNFNTRIIVVRADYLIDDSFFDPADISGGGSETCAHVWDEGVVVNEANCGVAGSKKFTCSVCHSTKMEIISATGEHTWGEWTTNETTHTRACTVCHTADSGSHDTAGAGGKCSVCGYNTTCIHAWDEGVVVNEANCGVAGSKKFTCSVCHSTKMEIISATGAHTWGEWTTNETTHTRVCTVCHTADSGSHNTEGEGGKCSVCGYNTTCTHEWGEGVVVNEANCGVAGSKKFTCSVCHSTKMEIISATGEHTWGEWTTNETTHTRACTVCHTADSGSHDTAGAGGKCSVCGYNTTCIHAWDEGVVVNEENCGVVGSRKFTCSLCGSTKTEPIPATGEHTWGEWTKNETTHTRACTVCHTADSGSHDTAGAGGKCSVCGYGAGVGDPCAEGHTVASWTVIQEATCTEAGYKVGNCTVCGELRVEEIPAGHNLVYYKTGNPYADKHLAICSVCNTMTTNENGVRCDTDGEGGTCSKCHSITHNCNVDGHIWYDNTTDYVCAICGARHQTTEFEQNHDTNGEGGCCSVCGYKAHEHDSTSWTVETAATCTTAGQEKGICTQCGITIRRSIPATGHMITSYTGFDMYNHMGECDTCHQAATQSHQYTLVSSADGVYYYQCACGVLMEVSGTNNPTHVHTNITINYNEWGKTTKTIDDKTYSVWICTCGGTSSCGATITYYVPVS